MDNTELKKRLELMEGRSYIYPEAFSKKDYIFTAAIALICLVFIIGGGFL